MFKNSRIFLFFSFADLIFSQYFSNFIDSQGVSFPLYGDIEHTAYWFTDVHIGYPTAQKQSLIIDTGSSVTAFPCSDCKRLCGKHLEPHFNYQISQSVQSIECSERCSLCSKPKSSNKQLLSPQIESFCAYHVLYTEGSAILGRWFSDHLWIDPPNPLRPINVTLTPIPFGCHHIETKLFFDQSASGILGLEPDSRNGPPTFITTVLSYLLSKNKTDINITASQPVRYMGFDKIKDHEPLQPQFSLCFSSSGGIFTIGDSNKNYHLKLLNSDRISNTKQLSTSNDVQKEYFSYSDFSDYLNDRYMSSINDFELFSPSQLTVSEDEIKSEPDAIEKQILQNSSELLIKDSSLKSSSSRNLQNSKTSLNMVSNQVRNEALYVQQNGIYPLANKIQWTPFVASVNSDARYDSYYVIIKSIFIKNHDFEEVPVKFPLISVPPLGLESPWQPTQRYINGAVALIDSGTTTSKLPIIIYSAVWNNIMQAIARRPRNLNYSENKINRVSGLPVQTMKSRLLKYIRKLEKKRTLISEKPQNKFKRSITDQDVNLTKLENKTEIDNLITYAMRNLENVENLENYDEIKKIITQKNTSTPKYRSLVEFNMNMSPNIHNEHRKLQQFRQTSVTPIVHDDTECWRLTDPKVDLKVFPEIKITFESNADYIWRPSSYLYKKGEQNVYCMTFQVSPDALDDDGSRSMNESSLSSNRKLGIGADELLLGSSFFINKDIIFHIGQWKLGFIEASCPKTNLVERMLSS